MTPALLTPAVKALLAVNLGCFLLELADPGLLLELALWPWREAPPPWLDDGTPRFHFWQLVSYGFLHGNLPHLLLNMYALWLFGGRMERVWGSAPFLLYYFVCLVGAGFTQLLVTTATGAQYPTVGASGGVFGLLLAYGLTFPEERLLLLFPPVVIEARWAVLLFGAIELIAGVTGTAAGVAHFAHLGGMFFGYLMLLHWRAEPPSS